MLLKTGDYIYSFSGLRVYLETSEHLLLRCTKHTNLRRKYNLPKDLKGLLGPDSPKDKIMLFLKKAGVYEEFDGDGDDDYDNEGLSPKFVNSRTKGKK